MFITSFRSSYGKALLSLFVVLALLIAYGGAPTQAQPPLGSFAYVFLWGSGSLGEGWGSAKLDVARLLVDMNHGVKHFKVCFTGTATPNTDFYLSKHGSTTRPNISSGCFTDTWASGDWYDGAENGYYIHAISDSVPDPNETIIATVSAADSPNHWGSGYHLFGSYATAKFTIRGG